MSEQARVKIACPECGAPLPPEAVDVAVKCLQCGHTSAPLPQTVVVERVVAASSMVPCPRCKAVLFGAEVHGVKLLGCGTCGGIFLDNEGSTRITRAPDTEIAQLAERAKNRAVATVINTRPSVDCPMCGAMMGRVFARGVVEVDFCQTHGTWFDRGELQRLMAAYAPRVEPPADDTRARIEAEARMVAFREQQSDAIDEAEKDSMVGGTFALVTAGLLGVLGALAGSPTKS